MSKLIALYSPAPGCGKTTIANFLCEQRGFTRISFADPMREMVRVLLKSIGYTTGQSNEAVTRDKEWRTVLPYQPTPRHLLQTLGTEWGRTCIGPNFWSELWASKAASTIQNGDSVVCDDLRFPEELDTVLALGGEAWRIERPGYEATPDEDGHASDGALEDHHQIWHQRIKNDGTVDMLLQYVRPMLKDGAGMKWNHRIALWIVSLLCPRLGKAAPPSHCPDSLPDLEPDELREADWHYWTEYISQSHLTENNRHYLEALWTKK